MYATITRKARNEGRFPFFFFSFLPIEHTSTKSRGIYEEFLSPRKLYRTSYHPLIYSSLYKRIFSPVQCHPTWVSKRDTFIEQFSNLRHLDTYKISRSNLNSLAGARHVSKIARSRSAATDTFWKSLLEDLELGYRKKYRKIVVDLLNFKKIIFLLL